MLTVLHWPVCFNKRQIHICLSSQYIKIYRHITLSNRTQSKHCLSAGHRPRPRALVAHSSVHLAFSQALSVAWCCCLRENEPLSAFVWTSHYIASPSDFPSRWDNVILCKPHDLVPWQLVERLAREWQGAAVILKWNGIIATPSKLTPCVLLRPKIGKLAAMADEVSNNTAPLTNQCLCSITR